METMLLPNKLKKFREQCELSLRKVAASLDIDIAIYCKIENGNYSPRKELVVQLADILKNELVKFLAGRQNNLICRIVPTTLKFVNMNIK